MEIFERVKELCKEYRISLKKLEEESGLSNGSIAKWRTYTPRAANLQKVANYFGVSLDYLLCRTDDRNPKEAPPVDEAKEANSALVELARSCPEEKADLMLRLMQTVLQDEKKE